jgi:hypothetical protein
VNITAKAQFHTEKAKATGGDGIGLSAPDNLRTQKEQRFEFVTTIQI